MDNQVEKLQVNDLSKSEQSTCGSRRSFLKKGAAISVPLIVTAFSRPVLAVSAVSGNMSGPGSGNFETQESENTAPAVDE